MSLRLQELRFRYPDKGFSLVVRDLQVDPGECVALVGPSGSGKTTLLNLIAGILEPTGGTITLGDHELSRFNERQRRRYRLAHMGMVSQSFELLDYLDVRDNVLLQARLCKDVTIDAILSRRAQDIVEQLGLGDKWRRNIEALSQGERQRVAICRALLLEPHLVLADEPTGNLDPDNKLNVVNKLIDDSRQNSRILLMVTHDHSLLPRFDRVLDVAALLESTVEGK